MQTNNLRVDDLSFHECYSYDAHPSRNKGYLRFRCPRHQGDHQQSLSVEESTGKFRCFNASCQIWGTVVEKKTLFRTLRNPQQNQMIKDKKIPPPEDSNNEDSNNEDFKNEDSENIDKWPTTLEAVNPLGSNSVGLNSLTTNSLATKPIATNLLPAKPLEPNQYAVNRAVMAWRAFPNSPAQSYAQERGIVDKWAKHLRLGYWKGKWAGIDSEWLTFPYRCPLTGIPVGVYGRNLHSDMKMEKARTLGPKGIFGATRSGQLPSEIILVEGPFEVFACLASHNLPPARAVIGVGALPEWFDHCSRLILLFDDDCGGNNGTERLIEALNARRQLRGSGPQVLSRQTNILQQQFEAKDLGDLLKQGIPFKLQLPT